MSKFIHGGSVHIIHDTGYRPSVACGSYSLDHSWPTPVGPLPPRTDLLHQTYQKYKKGHLRPKVRHPPSPYAISHRACLKADNDVAKAQKKEEEKPSCDPPSSFVAQFDAYSRSVVVPLGSTPCLQENPSVLT